MRSAARTLHPSLTAAPGLIRIAAGAVGCCKIRKVPPGLFAGPSAQRTAPHGADGHGWRALFAVRLDHRQQPGDLLAGALHLPCRDERMALGEAQQQRMGIQQHPRLRLVRAEDVGAETQRRLALYPHCGKEAKPSKLC